MFREARGPCCRGTLQLAATNVRPASAAEQLRFRCRKLPLSPVGCAACLAAARTRRDASKVTAAAGELRKRARRLLKRAVREVHA